MMQNAESRIVGDGYGSGMALRVLLMVLAVITIMLFSLRQHRTIAHAVFADLFALLCVALTVAVALLRLPPSFLISTKISRNASNAPLCGVSLKKKDYEALDNDEPAP